MTVRTLQALAYLATGVLALGIWRGHTRGTAPPALLALALAVVALLAAATWALGHYWHHPNRKAHP